MRRALATLATSAAGMALLLCVASPALVALVGSGLLQRAPGGASATLTASSRGTATPSGATAGDSVPRPSAPGPASPTLAGGQRSLPHGTLVLLRDTPHFWVADEQGVLHWVNGTRALVGRYVRWTEQRTVTAAELEQLPRGEPWLLAPLSFVRTEGPDLYVMVWQGGVTWPSLLRAPSIDALRSFGVTPEHVARLSTDERTWERLHNLTIESVAAELMPPSVTNATSAASTTSAATATGTSPSRAWWTEGQWSGTGAQVSPPDTYAVHITLGQPRVDPELGVLIGSVRYDSFPCTGFVGLISAGVVEGEEEVLLAERLTMGVENCTIQGRVTLTRRTDRRLFYTWSLPDRQMAVTGLLLRD